MNTLVKNPDRKDICATCGTRYASPKTTADGCPVCLDDRQYTGDNGQVWQSYNELAKNRSIRFTQLQTNLYALQVVPNFAIGQQAFLVLLAGGNVLWDCIPFLDAPTVAFIRSLGGLRAIAISHPHYYSLMVEWAEAFGCPVYVHAQDRQWVMHSSPQLQYWEGESKTLWDGMQLIHTGGHFPGSAVLHLPYHGNKGSLLTGDTIYVARDRKHVSFMYSYPNLIPLPKDAIEQIFEQVKDLAYETIYGAFEGQVIATDAQKAVKKSVCRYLSVLKA
ncbi:MBL fold metallo-hydrolase [Pontibacter sp. 172403-2]|uniref:MBL fold metallo-hydrolase n=1 Tax=Pontibacter rufus TaxID=2791028 RepID=UPI0018AF908F|nr:MBL fold metallo-hydrolase [Pontibacter sp. 172403-2]MBF9254477.1 MBL fold metallo-hydrolase [Pontibacter sp. 172403-2]